MEYRIMIWAIVAFFVALIDQLITDAGSVSDLNWWGKIACVYIVLSILGWITLDWIIPFVQKIKKK